jgi:hypothetical protein
MHLGERRDDLLLERQRQMLEYYPRQNHVPPVDAETGARRAEVVGHGGR